MVMSAKAGSISSIWALSQMKPLLHHQQRVDRLLHARGPEEWP
jgi:hypothetical protein